MTGAPAPILRLAGRWREEFPGSPGGCLLLPAGAVFAGLAGLRGWAFDRGLFRQQRLPVPVISLGNLTAGGTGKTPAVATVAAWLRARGRRPAVVSRGYRAGLDGRNEEASLMGDVPVFCNPDRLAGGRRAIADGADVVILDDGFQHRRLARDLDIVVIDATRPWGRDDGGPGRFLPAGYLRESPRQARRAGLLWLTRTDLVDPERLARLRGECALLAPGVPLVEERATAAWLSPMGSGDRISAADWAGRRVILASGLGHPGAFEAQAAGLGLAVQTSVRFPDHHHYRPVDVAVLERMGRDHQAVVVVTGKDAVKLTCLPGTGGFQILGITSALVDPTPLLAALARLPGV